MTLSLIDQSDPEKLKYRCDVCTREFVVPTRAHLDMHTPYAGIEAQKKGIPPCIVLAVVAAPATAKAPRVRKVKAAEVPAPKKRGRPRKTEVAP